MINRWDYIYTLVFDISKANCQITKKIGRDIVWGVVSEPMNYEAFPLTREQTSFCKGPQSSAISQTKQNHDIILQAKIRLNSFSFDEMSK